VPRPSCAGAPDGQLTWGIHVSLAPTWFDPADTQGIITPFMVLYALHDAVVKPMPGQPMAPSLAQSWSASEDALTYDFVLREGTTTSLPGPSFWPARVLECELLCHAKRPPRSTKERSAGSVGPELSAIIYQ
jgi:hypothetical protein